MSDSPIIKNHAAFIWSVADLLRGDYKQSEYGKVVLPLTVLRRLDCVLEPTKEKVLEKAKSLKGKIENQEPVLCAVAKEQFFNTSKLDMKKLLDDPTNLAANLRSYISAFSSGARDVLEKFDFDTQIARMEKANILYLVISKFAEIDLHPTVVSNLEMGYLYEELIRKFSELSNETAGEHFTPREVIRLMVNLLFIEDGEVLAKEGTVRTLFDPACGTGGMLSVGEDHLRMLNPKARLEVFGQELNPETYAICRSDMMLKGQDASHIKFGNSFSEDGHIGRTFDYCLANPPFGVDWRKVERDVRDEHETLGFNGRFGAGLPRINDGQFLFLQHLISKMKTPDQGGGRVAVIVNGSPLTVGSPGSDEAEIRRWIIESDLLESVVALPSDLFYNTGIATYIWILTNRKNPTRVGKIQLIDARSFHGRPKSIFGDKRKEILSGQIEEITRLYGDYENGPFVKISNNYDFGIQEIVVEQPLRAKWLGDSIAGDEIRNLFSDPTQITDGQLSKCASLSCDSRTVAEEKVMEIFPTIDRRVMRKVVEKFCVRSEEFGIVVDRRGNPEPDVQLRAVEYAKFPAGNLDWESSIEDRVKSELFQEKVSEHLLEKVHPFAADAWVDRSKTRLGYEIPFTKYFYRFEHDYDLAQLETKVIDNVVRKNKISEAIRDLEAIQVDRNVREEIPLGFLVKEISEKNSDGREDNRLSLSFGRIVRRSIDSLDGLRPESFDTYQIVRTNDIVLRLTDLQNDQRSLRVALVEEQGIISPAYINLRVIRNIDPGYLAVVLKSMDARKIFYALGGGIRQSLGFNELRRLMVPILDLEAQLHIAKIDQLYVELNSLNRESVSLAVLARQSGLASFGLGSIEEEDL